MSKQALIPVVAVFAALWFVACDLDGDAKDTASPSEDTVAADVIAPLDTVVPEDTSVDIPVAMDAIVPMDTVEDVPPPMDTVEDVPPPMDSVEDIPPPPDSIDIVDDVPEMPAACCLSDADCADVGDGGWTCAWGKMEAQNPAWGRCMGPLTWEENLCWDGGDCPEGMECMGATYCPCDMGCGMADIPGSCQDPETLGDVGALCGQSGGDCKPDLVCCYPCGIPDCQWQCAVPCDEDEQWCAGGCPMLP